MTTIQVSVETREKLNSLKTGKASHNDVINRLIQNRVINEATINQEGRFEGSKTLAGKKISYKVIE